MDNTTESLETHRFRMKPMDVVLSNTRLIFWKSVYNGRYIWLSSHDIDISQEATDDLLKHYIDDPNFRGDTEQKQKMLSRFMLGIGDGLYRNRKYILDRLENIPRGEDIFNMIMWNLQDFERRKEEGDYNRYPTSISDAREYFLTK